MAYVLMTSRWLLGLVFAVSALGKMRGSGAFRSFVDGLRQMRVLPSRCVGPVAVAVVAAEACIPLLLATAHTLVAGLGLAIAVLAVVTVTIVVVLRRRTPASCPCFGRPAVRFGRRHVVRNVALILAAGGAIAALAVRGPGAPPPPLPETVLAAVAAGMLAVVVIMTDDIAALAVASAHRPRRSPSRRLRQPGDPAGLR